MPHLIPNQPPSVKFTLAPVSADVDDPVFYAYRVFWSGNDPDGRVDHFDYAIDPGLKDTAWVSTQLSEQVLFFRSTTPDGKGGVVRHARDFHVLVIRAVDNQGAMSPRQSRAFYSYTVAPSVQITTPVPSALLSVQVPPSIFIHWQGSDPDGQVHTTPVYYRYRLLPFQRALDGWMLSNPDSLYQRELSDSLASWTTVGGDTTEARFTNLTPKSEYLFMLIAFDEAGARSPQLSVNENLLSIEVNSAATLGPIIEVFNEIIDFRYPSGGYTTDPLRWIPVESPANQPFRLNWDATASAGASIERFRWAVDLASVLDETPRSDEDHDYFHWSRGGPLDKSCVLVGLTPGRHFIYIEAKDNNGYASLGIVALTLVVPILDRELLVVNDCRFEVDQFDTSGARLKYTQAWPSTAELDTFLFARGGFPWRGTFERPHTEPTATSVPGLFAGYEFDSLGTRLGLEDPVRGVTLGQLSHYRHVVWILDADALQWRDPLPLSTPPATVLLSVSVPGRASALSAYVQGGGQVWLMGGGAAQASLTKFNHTRNDDAIHGEVYSNEEEELIPGRLMYDGPHWRSAINADQKFITFSRSPRADSIAAAPWEQFDRWSGGTLRAPDYRKLPAQLTPRDPGSDPMPPTRPANESLGRYYPSRWACEYLLESNIVTEDVDPSDAGVKFASTLDTLIDASSFLLLKSPAPTMTYYHGAGANRFVFSGFAPWQFRRDDGQALTDFVLHDVWGLERKAAAGGPAPAGVAAAGPGATRTVRPAGTRVSRAGYH